MFSLAKLGSYDPFEDFTTGFELLRPLRGELSSGTGTANQNNMLAMDMHETEQGFEAVFNVPGVPKENVKVNLDDKLLTVSVDYKREEQDKKGKYHWRERSEGHIQRSVQLPSTCDIDKITASQENGVLCIKVPKHAEKRTKSIKIT